VLIVVSFFTRVDHSMVESAGLNGKKRVMALATTSRYLLVLAVVLIVVILACEWSVRNTRRYPKWVVDQATEMSRRAANYASLARDNQSEALSVVHAAKAEAMLEAMRLLGNDTELDALCTTKVNEIEQAVQTQRDAALGRLEAACPRTIPTAGYGETEPAARLARYAGLRAPANATAGPSVPPEQDLPIALPVGATAWPSDSRVGPASRRADPSAIRPPAHPISRPTRGM
jgi:hypothetical protein